MGIGLALLSTLLPTPDARSFLFDTLGLVAAGGAVYGVMRNEPRQRGTWQLFALALVLFAAGDVVFDVARRGFGRPDGFPFADLVYLPAYPILAIALFRLARNRVNREAALDSAVVALALSAVIWVWAVRPVLAGAGGATIERLVAVAYPTMDILVVVVIVHAVFTLTRWSPAAWLLFVGLGVLLVADSSYARLVADGSYTDGAALDVLWPVAYLLLAAAVMHPSMAGLWEGGVAGPVRHGRARMVVLATALFAAPAVMVLGVADTVPTIALAAVTAVAAIGVAWRISRLVDESNQARVVLAESEARFRALVQHAADIIIVLSASGRVKYVSPAIEVVFSGRREVAGSSFVDYLDADGVEQSLQLYQDLMSNPEQPLTREFHAFDGQSWRWIESTWTNQLHEPAVRGIVGNLREITERKRDDAFAEAETGVLELILSGAPVPETLTTLVEALEAFVPDAVGTIRLLDPESGELEWTAAPNHSPEFLSELTRRTRIDDIQRSLSVTELHVMRDIATEGHRPEIIELCVEHGMLGAWSIPIRTPDGSELLGLLGLMLRTVRDPLPAELATLERVRDLVAIAVDRDAHARQLDHLALHDPLTKLPNRALAQDRLQHALARLANHRPEGGGDRAMVAVLFLDLDRFKLVNDGLGHETGDELLVAVSNRLRATVRRQDTIARLGGDEFVVLCEDLTDEDQAQELAERAAGAFAEPFSLTHAEVTVSASIGIAVTSDPSEHAPNLLHDADAAMYRAKRRGGARHELFDEAMHTQAVSRLLTERALRGALEHDELRVLFQPQFDLASGAPVALEALLRWDHPTRGIVRPQDFLKVAEETGIIVPIGEWVLERACELASSPRVDVGNGRRLAISTNVSCRQLQRSDFPALVERVVREFAIDPGTLCLEITESSLLEDLDATSTALHALKDLGVQLAIDDFGTGGSSLTYLRRFPFDELKVDRTFIERLGRDDADDAIVAATIDMAHALGMIVAAEGVETAEQLVRLRDLGCDRAQGFHLASPEAIVPRRLVLVGQQPA